jgi:hypothetical protein
LRRQHRTVAGARMVGMGMRNQRAFDRACRVNVKGAALATQSSRGQGEDIFRTHRKP